MYLLKSLLQKHNNKKINKMQRNWKEPKKSYRPVLSFCILEKRFGQSHQFISGQS